MTAKETGCRTYDVVVIGGGPAGCTAALQLARAGVSVLVLEQRSGYERRLGESLPSSATPLLRELGIWDDFLMTEPVPVWLNASAWGGPELHFDDFMLKGAGSGWHIDRGKFETLLSAAARRAGATILLGCSVVAVESDQYGHRLHVRQATLEVIRAVFCIDASGRGRHVWQPHKARKQYDQMIGVGLVARVPVREATSYTLIEAVSDGWLYSAQVSNDEIVACYMTDADLYARARIRSRDAFRARLAEARHTSARMTSASTILGPWCVAAGTSLRSVAAGANWMAIGDAAMSCDPLSASGLITALRSGMYAAGVVIPGNAPPDQNLEPWSDYLASAFRSYLTMRGHYYSLERRFPDSLFWKRRQNAAGEALPEMVPGAASQNSTS